MTPPEFLLTVHPNLSVKFSMGMFSGSRSPIWFRLAILYLHCMLLKIEVKQTYHEFIQCTVYIQILRGRTLIIISMIANECPTYNLVRVLRCVYNLCCFPPLFFRCPFSCQSFFFLFSFFLSFFLHEIKLECYHLSVWFRG